jgi:hypothetical protein
LRNANAVRLYFDNDSADRALIRALEALVFDCLDSHASDMARASDQEQLVFATALGRAIVTANQGDFARLHGDYIKSLRPHAGILIASKQLNIGQRVRALQSIRLALSQDALMGRIEWLTTWLPED